MGRFSETNSLIKKIKKKELLTHMYRSVCDPQVPTHLQEKLDEKQRLKKQLVYWQSCLKQKQKQREQLKYWFDQTTGHDMDWNATTVHISETNHTICEQCIKQLPVIGSDLGSKEVVTATLIPFLQLIEQGTDHKFQFMGLSALLHLVDDQGFRDLLSRESETAQDHLLLNKPRLKPEPSKPQ